MSIDLEITHKDGQTRPDGILMAKCTVILSAGYEYDGNEESNQHRTNTSYPNGRASILHRTRATHRK